STAGARQARRRVDEAGTGASGSERDSVMAHPHVIGCAITTRGKGGWTRPRSMTASGNDGLVGEDCFHPFAFRQEKKLPVPRTGERREAPAPGAASRDRAALSACPRR